MTGLKHFKAAVFAVVLLFSVSLPYVSSAYALKKYNVHVKVLDKDTGKPLDMATVRVMKAADTASMRYSVTASDGSADILGVVNGEYVVAVDYMGYIPFSRLVSVKDASVDLGSVYLEQESNLIGELVVSAVGNPIVVKKDTIEYTATSYKSADSDMLEDLLKKLPGVEVDSEGKITANGEEITKIMIDGKEFFLNDPQLATKNLPANIIDKIKVVERKSDQARFSGIDDGESETVIDLSVKKGMMDGWFGNAMAGYGTDNRFQGGLMASKITKESQLTFILNANNTNNRGFFDFAGSMMNSMKRTHGGVQLAGAQINFGGSGITSSWLAGVNGNGTFLDGKLKVSGNYMYSGSENDKIQDSYKETFLQADTVLVNDTGNESLTRSQSHSFGGEVDWQITDRTSVLFRPKVSLGEGTFDESSQYSTVNTFLGDVNSGESSSYGYSRSVDAEGKLLLRHRFVKPGRTVSLDVDYGYSMSDMDAFNKSLTRMPGEAGVEESTVDQNYFAESETNSVRARLSYTEPLGRKFFLEAAYTFNYTGSYSSKDTKSFNSESGAYDIPEADYTNSFNNLFINHKAELNVTRTTDKYLFVAGANVQPSYTKSSGTLIDYSRNVLNFSPNARFEYRFSENEELKIRYGGRTVQPTVTQLQPVPDNSNPLYVSLGNPDLDPEFNHTMRIEYKKSDRKTFSMMFARLRLSYVQDKIVNSSWYDESGIQYTKPVNTDGAYDANAIFMANIPFGKSGFSFMTRTFAKYGNSYSYVSDIANNVQSMNVSEWMRFMYRGKTVEASLGGAARYSMAWYSMSGKKSTPTWTNTVTAYLNITLPWDISIKTDANYNFYIGYDDSYSEPSVVWNAEISKQLFKKKATIAIKAYDILGQAKGLYRVTDDEYVMDVSTNALQRYIMLSFIYRFGDFGQQRGRGMHR